MILNAGPRAAAAWWGARVRYHLDRVIDYDARGWRTRADDHAVLAWSAAWAAATAAGHVQAAHDRAMFGEWLKLERGERMARGIYP